jgi:hypothetical protein
MDVGGDAERAVYEIDCGGDTGASIASEAIRSRAGVCPPARGRPWRRRRRGR